MRRLPHWFLLLALLTACHVGRAPSPPPTTASAAPTFAVSDAELPSPLTFIVYGDMRFTSPGETEASRPLARRALVEGVAAEQPAALFLTGDVPWHGVSEDYAVYREETGGWRRQHLRVYPALGNHEFSHCSEADCLARWRAAFPELQGRRWYSLALGSKVRAIALDSNASLLPGSEQRAWLEAQMSGLSGAVRVVLVLLHHPPVADPISGGGSGDHRVRPNEAALATYLEQKSRGLSARIVVVAGHIHNYERFAQGGVTYLVSGGGGAQPYPVERSDASLFKDPAFPNFHYIKFELEPRRLTARMLRLALNEDGTPVPGRFEIKDRFEIALAP